MLGMFTGTSSQFYVGIHKYSFWNCFFKSSAQLSLSGLFLNDVWECFTYVLDDSL